MKKGDMNQVGVMALADGDSVEYRDEGNKYIKRKWNGDGTAAHDSVISKEEYDAATKPKPVVAPKPVPSATKPPATAAAVPVKKL